MFRKSADGTGPKHGRAAPPRHRPIASIELITTAALALSTVVAVAAVSIGIARADAIGAVQAVQDAPVAIAVFIGLLLSAMGTFTAIAAVDPARD
jgi:hypothetical protein